MIKVSSPSKRQWKQTFHFLPCQYLKLPHNSKEELSFLDRFAEFNSNNANNMQDVLKQVLELAKKNFLKPYSDIEFWKNLNINNLKSQEEAKLLEFIKSNILSISQNKSKNKHQASDTKSYEQQTPKQQKGNGLIISIILGVTSIASAITTFLFFNSRKTSDSISFTQSLSSNLKKRVIAN